MAEILKAYKPLSLREKLDPLVYECTLFREEEDEDPEGELFEDCDAEPLVVYGFWFKPLRGAEIPLTPTEFDVLCSMASSQHGINLARMKQMDQSPGTVGQRAVQSLEGRLIPEGLAEQSKEDDGNYVLSEFAMSGEYFAQEKIAGAEGEE
jgi:hypothetical protein